MQYRFFSASIVNSTHSRLYEYQCKLCKLHNLFNGTLGRPTWLIGYLAERCLFYMVLQYISDQVCRSPIGPSIALRWSPVGLRSDDNNILWITKCYYFCSFFPFERKTRRGERLKKDLVIKENSARREIRERSGYKGKTAII